MLSNLDNEVIFKKAFTDKVILKRSKYNNDLLEKAKEYIDKHII